MSRSKHKFAGFLLALPITAGLLQGCDPVYGIDVENKSGTAVEVRVEEPGYTGSWIHVPNGEQVSVMGSISSISSSLVLHFRANGRDWRERAFPQGSDGRRNYIVSVKLPFRPNL